VNSFRLKPYLNGEFKQAAWGEVLDGSSVVGVTCSRNPGYRLKGYLGEDGVFCSG